MSHKPKYRPGNAGERKIGVVAPGVSELEPRYDHLRVEEEIYKKWEKSGYFNPDNLPVSKSSKLKAKSFCIIMPPPNANGSLHAGHALFITIEDIIIRYQRMLGRRALWLPGADHAGFETQIVYERKLEKEGRSRMGMKRQALYDEIMVFTLTNKKHMEDQVRSMGASCDWSREKFTLDPKVVEEVQKTFVKMYKDGLIYRGKRIINWCPKHQTSLSDVETEFTERKDPFYYFKYGPFIIGTARPETKFGDKYVVMHPADKRYAKYKHGQKIDLEWINGPVTATVIKDKAVDVKFGTGVMTITPWHDAVDFEIAERHKLDKEQIIDFRGRLLPIAGEFAGMKIEEARPGIVEKLKSKGLLEKIDENYEHSVRVCYKCERHIEPQIMDQWFVKMKPLAAKAAATVRAGKIKFVPERFKKVFLYWMDNTIDWNVSRQIAWGIRIPAWFHEPKCVPIKGREKDVAKCEEVVVSEKEPRCEFCGAKYVRDPDVFDTWFSSGQWPLLTLGYPNGKDLKTFYPTQVMETGYDLIFKWVPRMVIFGLYLKNKVPFTEVYLHGLVLDAQKKKMSKSRGNVMDPLELTRQYGTDALRMALVVGNPPGADLALSEDKIRGYRNFSTKVWNIARFVLAHKPEQKGAKTQREKPQKLTAADKKHIAQAQKVKARVAKHLEKYEFHLAAEAAYHYTWHTFADKIIESAKARLNGEDASDKAAAHEMLQTILLECLTMLHPFTPFLTEAIYDKLPADKKDAPLLMVRKW